MSPALVVALRAASLLAFAAPLLLTVGGRRRFLGTRPGQGRGDRVPLFANLTAFGLFLSSLLAFRGPLTGYTALVLALESEHTGPPVAAPPREAAPAEAVSPAVSRMVAH